jgi:hypothetical protein
MSRGKRYPTCAAARILDHIDAGNLPDLRPAAATPA